MSALKHELPGEDNRFGKIAVDNAAKLLQLIDDVRAHGDVAG